MTQHALLKTEDPNIKRVAEYLEQFAKDNNWQKIEESKKTIDECWGYILAKAKQKAIKGTAVLTDEEVFGLAVHFYDELGNVDTKPLEFKRGSQEDEKKRQANRKAIDKYNQYCAEMNAQREIKPKTRRKKETEDENQLRLF